VEFGCPDYYFCSNTAYLAETGWKVTMYDNNNGSDPRITRAEITKGNVNQLVGSPTVLSIDIDNDDFWVWMAYLGMPAIVIIEINSGIHPTLWEVPGNKGTSYKPMVTMGLNKGYMLICHTGNLIFVDSKYANLFPELTPDPLKNWKDYFNQQWL